MSKIIILGDLHIGARLASTQVMEHQLTYFEEQVFPYMKKHGISTILQLGDMFDTRKFSNHLVLYNWRKRFFNFMEDNGISFVTILGNHDIFFKNTLEVNSTQLFLEQYSNITIIDNPSVYDFDGVDFLLVPWICDANRDDVDEMVRSTTAPFCAGHFEFAGFEMHPGYVVEHGDDVTQYSEFDVVFSGHYHTKTTKGNIQYVGTPYELSWSDFDDNKGFIVFDTKTHKQHYIENDKKFFVKIEYNDKDVDLEYYKTFHCSESKNSYVKLVVANKTNPFQFEKILEKILSYNPLELKIIDIFENFDDIVIDDDIQSDDTPTLIENFINQVDTGLDRDKLLVSMKTLYVEAIHL